MKEIFLVDGLDSRLMNILTRKYGKSDASTGILINERHFVRKITIKAVINSRQLKLELNYSGYGGL